MIDDWCSLLIKLDTTFITQIPDSLSNVWTSSNKNISTTIYEAGDSRNINISPELCNSEC